MLYDFGNFVHVSTMQCIVEIIAVYAMISKVLPLVKERFECVYTRMPWKE